jgi:ATP-dependent DNA ligase
VNKSAKVVLAIGIMLQRTLPAGFIAPCLPTRTTTLPSGSQWLHEIKHDGFRINGWSYQLCSS